MNFSQIQKALPQKITLLSVTLAAFLLAWAFPDYDIRLLAYVAFVPLLFSVKREKDSLPKAFLSGWLFGTIFFVASCGWITFAPIVYGGIPAIIAYFLLLLATLALGAFAGIFAGATAFIIRRCGSQIGFTAAAFLWTTLEFLRFWTTGNNWNAVAYSQAFAEMPLHLASFGGIYLVGFFVLLSNVFLTLVIDRFTTRDGSAATHSKNIFYEIIIALLILILAAFSFDNAPMRGEIEPPASYLVAVQPNVPMSGIKYDQWTQLRDDHFALAAKGLTEIRRQKDYAASKIPVTVVFPESPMNFGYTNDLDFRLNLRDFTEKNDINILYNAAEPTADGAGFYNSAVLVDRDAQKIAQYDKIYLVPFGEYVPLPAPFEKLMPALVGSFHSGAEYDILPIGAAQAGVMICFESHFPNLTRQFALRGADVLIEMTNDGYLGQTPILRQHLANAVFRAVETNRPVLRATNVGITAYINNRGRVSDSAAAYTQDVRVWKIYKADEAPTFYVKYGDWFAWLCSALVLTLLFFCFKNMKGSEENLKSGVPAKI